MSFHEYAPGSRLRALTDRFGFPHLLATTLVLVGATILLGVAAKATGSGLGCEANWPRCDAGPYKLFPAHVVSFYEWFHRFVSMFAGFAIVATAIASVRSPDVDRRVAALIVLGTVLTPVQVYLGRETVFRYEMEILSLHFWTAVLIFALFVVATVLVWMSRLRARHVTYALAAGAVTLPFHVALSPLFLANVADYSPRVQIAQYGVTLLLLSTGVVTAMVGHRRFESVRIRRLCYATPLLAFLSIFFGRQSAMRFDSLFDPLYVLFAAALLATFLAGIHLTRAKRGATRRGWTNGRSP